MEAAEIIANTQRYVQTKLANDSTGHDWWHVYRVWRMARHIAYKEQANLFITELAALLHDIADWKLNGGDCEAGPKEADICLRQWGTPKQTIQQVCDIIRNISFKGAKVPDHLDSLEAKVVQDADRLDAMGAIGVARTFFYGGFHGRTIYDPAVKPMLHESAEDYQQCTGPTINHFYEKLLLLKDRMKTPTGRELALARHGFMERFLEEFFQEWGGEA